MVMLSISCNSTKGLSSYELKAYAFMNDTRSNKKSELSKKIVSPLLAQKYLSEDILSRSNTFGMKEVDRDNIDFKML